MASLSYIPSFYFYKFANAISSPYTMLNAYQAGAIDENGNIVKTEGSIDEFEYFVIKIKKIFEQLPMSSTKAKLNSLLGVVDLFSEDVTKFGITNDQFIGLMEGKILAETNNEESIFDLIEDMTAGGIGGAGTLGTPAEAPEANKGNVSGFEPVMGPMQTRTSPVNMVSSVEMFEVTPDEFKQFKNSKAWKSLPDSSTKRYLQRYQRRNKEGKMAVRNKEDGEIYFLPYKEKSLVEEFGLGDLDILHEKKVDTKDKITHIFKNLADNIAGRKNQNDINVKGSKEEHIARLIHAVRSLHTVSNSKSDQEKGLDMFIGAFNDLSSKGTYESGMDAAEISNDENGNLKKIDLDVKGHTTTPEHRFTPSDYARYGITPMRDELKYRFNDQKSAQRKYGQDSPQYVLAKKGASEQRKKIISTLRTQASDTPDMKNEWMDIVVKGYGLDKPEGMSWSIGKAKGNIPYVLPETPTSKQSPFVVVSPKVLHTHFKATPQDRVNVSAKEADVFARLPPLNPTRQQNIRAISKDMGTGNLVSADIDMETMSTLKNWVGHEDGLHKELEAHLTPFIKQT
jgi:hypothetical protein